MFAFKRDELATPVAEIIRDVGPMTVRRLDETRASVEVVPPPTTLVRQDAWVLGPESAPFHPILLAYARAVGVLKVALDGATWALRPAVLFRLA